MGLLQRKRQENHAVPSHLWIDADPSGMVWSGLDCDDDLALLSSMALHQRGVFSIEGLSVCGGNAPLVHTWENTQRLLDHAGSTIEPMRGYGWHDMQISREWLRQLNRLFPDAPSSEDAVNAIIEASLQDHSLSILTLGPPTNLAKAIGKDPTLPDRLEHVYMMGGELTGRRLDLNFATDREAARIVVDANVPVTLVPVQLCGQIIVDLAFLKQFKQTCACPQAAACAILPKMKQQVRAMPGFVNKAVKSKFETETTRWKPSPNLLRGFIPWDMVALLVASHPDLFDEYELHTVTFPVCTEEGIGGDETCGLTMTTESLSTPPRKNHSGVVRVPHLVRNETIALQTMLDLMCQIPAHGPKPSMVLGFFGPLATTCAVILVVLIGTRLNGIFKNRGR